MNMTAIEKAKLALNTLENVVPKNYDPQEAFDIDDLLTVILSRVDLSKKFLTEAIAAIDAEKPAVIKDSLTTEKQATVKQSLTVEKPPVGALELATWLAGAFGFGCSVNEAASRIQLFVEARIAKHCAMCKDIALDDLRHGRGFPRFETRSGITTDVGIAESPDAENRPEES